MIKKIFLVSCFILVISGEVIAQIVPADGDTVGADATYNQGDLTINDDLVVTDAVTVTGLSTLNGQLALGSETVAGAGTTVADAAALSASVGVHRITGANGTVGWKFVTGTPIGSVQILLNTTAGVAKIYGESGSTINGASADAAFSALTGIKPIICVKTAALTYLCA